MMPADFVDERLNAMLQHPDSWGGPEAFELQVLLLLESAQTSFAGRSGQESLVAFQDRYAKFLRRDFPKVGARPLSTITDDVRVIAGALKAFREILEAEAEATALAGDSTPEAPDDLGSDVDVEPLISAMPRKAAA